MTYHHLKKGQDNICSICLPKLRKTENGRDFIQCPTCCQKYFTSISEIPKCRVIMDLIESKNGSMRTTNYSTSSSLGLTHYEPPSPYTAQAQTTSQTSRTSITNSNRQENINTTSNNFTQPRNPPV